MMQRMNKPKRTAIRIAVFFGVSLLGLSSVAPFADADADAEREALARLVHELQSLEPLISGRFSNRRYLRLDAQIKCLRTKHLRVQTSLGHFSLR